MNYSYCYSCMSKLPAPDTPCPHCGSDNRELALRQPPHALSCGEILQNKYLVGKVLSQNSFGIVYIGWDEALETRICIKEYFPLPFAARSDSRSNTVVLRNVGGEDIHCPTPDSIIQEARKVARLHDLRSFVTVWDVFQENETAYIVLDLIKGTSLKSYLSKTGKPLDERACYLLFKPVIADLAAVHKYGIIHRGISLNNLMLRPDGSLILLELGTVIETFRLLPDAVTITNNCSPPELFNRRMPTGPWTDVYSICAAMVYCGTGKPIPHMADRCSGAALDLSGFSPAFAAVLESGLAMEPTERIQSMDELLRRFEAALSTAGDIGKEIPADTAKEQPPAPVSEKPQEIEHPPQKNDDPTPRKPVPQLVRTLLAAVLMLALAGTGVYLIFSAQPFARLPLPAKSAAQPDSELLIQMGRASRDTEDYSTALQYFIEAADAGDARAMEEIKALYILHRITPEDQEMLLRHFIQSADRGNAPAMTAIGDLYAFGIHVHKNTAKAQAWYNKGINAGDRTAMVQLGTQYLHDPSITDNSDIALGLFQKAAKAGQTTGMTQIGNMYLYGEGVETDYEKALDWYKKAVEKKSELARIQLGYVYANGLGVQQNYAKALDLYQDAADAGNAAAMTGIGDLYMDGFSLYKDYVTAREWYQRAYIAGDINALNRLGSLYQNGLGVDQDFAAALSCYQEAAEAGDAAAMLSIGSMYQNGWGVKKDSVAAGEWYQQAAAAGSTEAEEALRSLRADG